MTETEKEEKDEKEQELFSKDIGIESPSSNSKSVNKILIIVIAIIAIVIIGTIIFLVLFKKDKDEEKDEGKKGPLIFNSTGIHTYTLIFMPGFANQPEDFTKTLMTKMNYAKKNETTIIILRSPCVDVSVTHGKNYSWFDIYSFPFTNYSCYNFTQLQHSAKILEDVINSEVNILNGDYNKIIIGGHSQGAFISLYQAYNSENNYGGVFAFSGVLSPGDIIKEKKNNLKTFFAYGDKDDFILPEFMLESIDRIKDFDGFEIHRYVNHTHYVKTQEAVDAAEFLNRIME